MAASLILRARAGHFQFARSGVPICMECKGLTVAVDGFEADRNLVWLVMPANEWRIQLVLC